MSRIELRFAGFVLYIWLALSPRPAGAVSESLKEIMRARSSARLRSVIEADARLRHLRLVCEAQLATAKLPSACFEVLNLEKSTGLMAETAAESEFRWLGSLCESRAQRSRDSGDLGKVARGLLLPETCRRAARERLADLDYAAERDSPGALFARRSLKGGG